MDHHSITHNQPPYEREPIMNFRIITNIIHLTQVR